MYEIDRELRVAQAKIGKLEAAMALMQEQLEKVWYAPGMPGTVAVREDFEKKARGTFTIIAKEPVDYDCEVEIVDTDGRQDE